MTDLRYDGRVAVITGAGRGLGREFALELARRGASVVVNDIGSSVDSRRYGPAGEEPDPANEVVTAISRAGGRAVANRSSVSDPAGAASIVETALDAFGRVDIVINNAGIVITGPFPELTTDDLSVSYDVHVKGPFMISQRAWGPMSKQGFGRILNVCSVDGFVIGNPNHAAYDAAKGGLAGLTRAMASEGTAVGINVNGLLPGAFTRGQASVEQSLSPVKAIDMRPHLVAPTACWLVHEDCDVAGAFFSSSSGRIGRVFTGTAAGYQTIPDDFSIEGIRDNWDLAQSYEPYVSPRSAQDYNAFRIALFHAVTAEAN
jgi:NAD(P)-dependent dehydrogenase (short-subunit alcohol dehydrogenase family)